LGPFHIKIEMLAICFKVTPRTKNETGPRKKEEKGTERDKERWSGWRGGRILSLGILQDVKACSLRN
jgi:hypothetical protein